MATELMDAIADLKTRIQQDVRNRVAAFERRTGLTPAAIEVNMIDVTSTTDQVRRSVVGQVTIDIGSF